MSITQLDPQIPVVCPKGKGFAIALIDYSQEHEILWVISITETGEFWTFPNSQVRAVKNITMGRDYSDKSVIMDAEFQ